MNITQVQKRDGTFEEFYPQKITNAITSAFKATHHSTEEIPSILTHDVILALEEKRTDDSIPSIEDIQDIVELILIRYGYNDIAKAYILYREKRYEQRKDKQVMVAVDETISEYLDQADWRVNANSNQGYSLGGLILNTSGKVTANYWLSHIYPSEVGEAHRKGDMHIHDLDMFSGYCAGWSLRYLLENGFNGVPNKVESHAPKHLHSAVAQMINFLGTLQNEWAGAQAFSSFDTLLAPYVRKYRMEMGEELDTVGAQFASDEDKEEYLQQRLKKYVYQQVQSLVFNLNVPSRWGTQTPFTNITLDWTCPEDMKDDRLLLDGEKFSYTFGELQEEMEMLNEAFIDIMIAGDEKGRTFTFPIPTVNITKDFDWHSPVTEKLFEMTAKYGTPYFQNFINSDLNPGDVRSMCCRLQLDLKELRKRGGGLFGSSEMTGSIGVVTINAARLGYEYAGDKEAFFKQLEYLMELAKTSLEIKRKEILLWMERGLFPYTKRYLGRLTNHFSTIGINGVNEAIRNFTGDAENIATPSGQQFAVDVLDFMRGKIQEFQEETGNLYNLEATPGEGATYRFAREDKKKHPDILQAGTEEAPYYTNSTQIPVGYTDDIFDALELQDDLQTRYTGGTVLHGYMGERISDSGACKQLVKTVLSNFHLPYFTVTPTFSICPKHGYLDGEHDYCPKCDTEIGYAGPTIDWESRKKYESATAEK